MRPPVGWCVPEMQPIEKDQDDARADKGSEDGAGAADDRHQDRFDRIGKAGRDRIHEAIEVDVENAGEAQPDRAERLKSVIPIGRFGEPGEVAQTVLYLMSDEASYVVGANVSISGGR